ncbi:MAG: hypothetical protein WBZ36_30895 [Candidatus Nitrosopolaris sp.]
MLKIMAIAMVFVSKGCYRYFSYQNEDDLLDFIAPEMQKEGLDPK